MSEKSNKSSTRKSPKVVRNLSIDHDRKLMARARQIANQYTIIVQPQAREGFEGGCLEFPTIWAFARTETECFRKMRQMLAIGVYTMLESKQMPPIAASEERRNAQVNIRLTAEEKLLLENAAKRFGFRGISDFIRTAALAQTRKSA